MNSNYFFEDMGLIAETLVGTFVMYMVIIVYTRLYGLKTFSKMTSYDFANTVAIGSLIASSIAGGRPSLFMGAIILGCLYLFNYLVTLVRQRSRRMQRLMDNTPLLLMREGDILYNNLQTARITEDELRAKLREANVLQLRQVKAVILETTGDVSVLHTDKDMATEDYLLEGVRESAD